jgi:cyclohexa-1,5-dienecarbonyl-CoA hydratase
MPEYDPGYHSRVSLTVTQRVATVTLNRPPLNILDLKTIAALDTVCDRLAAMPDLQLVVLRGAGPKAFCAGVDIAIHTREMIPKMLASFHGMLLKWWNLEALTVAAVHGHCLGGGMELAAVCDLVLACEAARFGQPEIKVGCYPPVAAALYPALLGPGRSLDLITTGRILTALEAERWGFVTRLAPAEGFEAAVAALVQEITSGSAVAQKLAKKAVHQSLGGPFERALAASERIYLEEMATTHDVEEGAQAFLEKRAPVWQHR